MQSARVRGRDARQIVFRLGNLLANLELDRGIVILTAGWGRIPSLSNPVRDLVRSFSLQV
jgi:hypothetical protein